MSAKRPSILMIFLDGVGLASRRDRDNPFATDEYAGLSAIAGGLQWTRETFAQTDSDLLRATGIDACLGIDGLPQSGTGQATLFTGVNCAAIVGRHHGPYPHSSTRETIRTRNIFHQLGLRERDSAFANAYPPVFFEYARRTDRWPVTTRCCLDAGIRIRTADEIAQNQAIAADLTGVGLATRVPDVRRLSEDEAAGVLSELAGKSDFTLFEYFLTDKAGHSADASRARVVLSSLDSFFGALARSLDFSQTTLVVTSDHGNIEDLRTRSHTRNPVPLLARGWAAPAFADVRSLIDVAPAITAALGHS